MRLWRACYGGALCGRVFFPCQSAGELSPRACVLWQADTRMTICTFAGTRFGQGKDRSGLCRLIPRDSRPAALGFRVQKQIGLGACSYATPALASASLVTSERTPAPPVSTVRGCGVMVTITEEQARIIMHAMADARAHRERMAEQIPSQRKEILGSIEDARIIEEIISSWVFCRYCGAADVSESDVGMAWTSDSKGRVCPVCQDEHLPDEDPCCEVCCLPSSAMGELSHRAPATPLACGVCNRIRISVDGSKPTHLVLTDIDSKEKIEIARMKVGEYTTLHHGAGGDFFIVRLTDEQ